MTGEMGSVSELSHLYIILYNIMLLYYVYIYYYILWFTQYRQTTLWKYKKKPRFWTETLSIILKYHSYTIIVYHLYIIFHWLNHVNSTIPLGFPSVAPSVTRHILSFVQALWMANAGPGAVTELVDVMGSAAPVVSAQCIYYMI